MHSKDLKKIARILQRSKFWINNQCPITGSQLYKNEIHKFTGLVGAYLMKLYLCTIWIILNVESQRLEKVK